MSEAYLERPLDADRLARSLLACPTPGRFDVVRTDPFALVDACHNPQSCEAFVSALDELAPRIEDRPTLLVAALADKDVTGILDVLLPAFPSVAVTQTSSDRAVPAHELARQVAAALDRAGRPGSDLVAAYPAVADALEALGGLGLPLVAAGTITLAGEVAGILRP